MIKNKEYTMSATSLSPTPIFNPNDLGKITSIDSTLDELLKAKDFKKAVSHCLSLNVEEAKKAAEKIADSLQGANLNEADLKEIKTAISISVLYTDRPFATVIGTLLKGLLSVAKTLGNQTEIKDLEFQIKLVNRNSKEYPCESTTSVLWDLFVFYVAWFQPAFPNRDSYQFLHIRYGVPLSRPVLQKTENRLGLDAGIIASGFFGVNALPAVGIGLSAALAARVPLIQKVFNTTIEESEKAIESMIPQFQNFPARILKVGLNTALFIADSAPVRASKKWVDTALNSIDSKLDFLALPAKKI